MVSIPKLFPSTMKEELIINKFYSGFSTLEMLIAMAILILVISAVILVSFGSQSMLIDSQTNSEALNKAQKLLEEAQAKARKDFNLVNPVAEFTDGIYQKKVDVELWKDPITDLPDFFTKKVTATVSWKGEHNRNLNVSLSALVTNFNNAVGGDTCNSVLTGDWTQPNPPKIIFVSDVDTDSSLSVDAYNRKLFVAIGDAYASSASTIFVYDLADPANPTPVDFIDNDPGIKAGINDIHVADKYLYVAKATGPASGQLQIFNISNLHEPPVNFKVSGVTGTGNEAIGKSIFYKDGYVYLGLTATDSGSEFHIIDVHDPNNPFDVGQWPSVGNINHDINAIYVKNGYAYLATADNDRELIILKVNNPSQPELVGIYNAEPDQTGLGNGKSLYLVGDTLFFGRTFINNADEFYILNNFDSAHISTISTKEISSSVNGLIVRDYLAFLITIDGQFQIWRIDNPSSINSYFESSITGKGTSLDCEGNYFYAGSVDSGDNKGYLSIITTPITTP
jgi:Tfp pilus assembly protein PilV